MISRLKAAVRVGSHFVAVQVQVGSPPEAARERGHLARFQSARACIRRPCRGKRLIPNFQFLIPNSSLRLALLINEEVVFIDEDEAVAGDALGDGGGYGVAFVFDFGRVFDTDLRCCGVNAGFISVFLLRRIRAW